ncbi:FG-GAP-like repeat-containing protein [Streptomyces sp. NBC_00663]|uniref:FG-GAP-like repeat-containing protein n=1 Tax=Streptomyces sp. NBC_00663 TaxID=2975801 RepID=UPI002E304B87|nr:FG-GAP-like repeat-containing protein [Streptomyces sp. NBC_00663]
MRIRTATTIAALLTAGLSLASPASAAPAKYADDFNGDGYRDYASSWGEGNEGGGVLITFGTATGPGTKTQVVSQSSAGVPGTDEADDGFGTVRAAADFNADGYGDLAVGAPGEDIDGRRSQGAVTVLWGSASGLSGGTNVPAKARTSSAAMGSDLAVGDFNGDGKKDLTVVAAGKAYVYRGAINRSGVHGTVSTLDKSSSSFHATAVIAGSVNGDGKTDLVVIGDGVNTEEIWSEAWFVKGGTTLSSGRTLRLESQPGGGGTAYRGGDGVIADFDKDGYGDIAVGTSLYAGRKGRVTLWYGSSSGPGTSARITQNTSGVSGTAEANDLFGDSVSAGDVNGDGYKDLAVGAYGETIDGKEYAGVVHVLYGRASGLTGTGSQVFTRNSAGIPGALEADDCFGALVRLRDTDRDGHADLFVSAQVGALRLPGTSSGVTTTGITSVPADGLISGMLQ